MNYYENIVILNPSLDEEGLDQAQKKILDTIEKASGEVLKHEKWGKKKLAYELNKQETGYYILLVFRSPAAAVKALERFYKVFDPVFKFMVIRLGKKQIQALEKSLQAQEAKVEAQAQQAAEPAPESTTPAAQEN